MNNQELISFLDEKLPKITFYVSFLVIFIPCYVYCIATHGFLWGLGLGWLPGGFVACAFWVLLYRALRKLIIWYDPVVRGNMRRRGREAVNVSQSELTPGQQLLQQYRAAVARLPQDKPIAASPTSVATELDLFNIRMRRVLEGVTPERPTLALCGCTFELCGHPPGERCGKEAIIRLRYSISLGPVQYNHFGPVKETGLCPACWRTIFAKFPEPSPQTEDKS